ncbi:hypothetical protein [Winogradskyella pulchriflava]|uniref:HEPN AbiU2-like domain-containing protein n=1 Tax=Winogradskyella pulchriflava TaxID=1110688 RepID=A0ABV6Q7M9_9FLAO
MEEVLLKILPAQNYMIDKIMINSDYIFRHNQEQYRRPPKISNCQYLRYLASVISDDIIVNLYKLLKDTQHHSFQKLNAKIEYFIKQGDFEFKSKEKEEFFDAYMKDLKNLISLYNKINWEGIRNKYVGHLDRNRPAIKFELSELKKFKFIYCL